MLSLQPLLSLLILLPTIILCDSGVSLCSAPAFTSLRSCARGCLANYQNGAECANLAGALSCEMGAAPWALNSCVCRSDLISVGDAYLSSCVASACSSNSVDIGQAISIYENYCSNTGAAPTPITLVATTTAKGGAATTIAGATITTAEDTSNPYVVYSTATVTVHSGSTTSRLGSTATLSDNTSPLPSDSTLIFPSSPPSTSFSTSTSTSTETVSSGSGPSNASPSGLSKSDQIALGLGLSIPLAGLIISICTCIKKDIRLIPYR